MWGGRREGGGCRSTEGWLGDFMAISSYRLFARFFFVLFCLLFHPLLLLLLFIFIFFFDYCCYWFRQLLIETFHFNFQVEFIFNRKAILKWSEKRPVQKCNCVWKTAENRMLPSTCFDIVIDFQLANAGNSNLKFPIFGSLNGTVQVEEGGI